MNDIFASKTQSCRRLLALLTLGFLISSMSPFASATCTYTIDSEWNTGFVARITVTNSSSSAVSDWRVDWEYNGANRVSNLWNATLSGDNPYSAVNVSWNGNLQPNQSAEFGFQGAKNGDTTEIPVLEGPLCNGPSPATPTPTPSPTVTPMPGAGVFRVDGTGNITKNGEVIPIQCGNWFGLEGRHEPSDDDVNPSGAPMELYLGNTFYANSGQGTGRTAQQTFTEIKAQGINVIRFPIVPQTLDPTDPQGTGTVLKNHPSVRGINARKSMEDFIKLADQNDVEIILDIHSCSNYLGWRAGRLDAVPPYADADRENYDFKRENYACGPAGPGVTVQEYNETKWLDNLRELAGLSSLLGVDNILGIDIFNEPYDYTWNEWKTLSEKAYQAIDSVNSNVLIFVEGVSGSTRKDGDGPHGDVSSVPNWGENLFGQATDPLNIPKDRLVLSPHTYGPSVFVKGMFIDPSQANCAGLEGDEAGDADCNIVINPALLNASWEEHFGYLRAQGFAMVVGEFGGHLNWPNGSSLRDIDRWSHITPGVDEQWQNAFVDYMTDKGIQACYWSINPESGDTGGLYQHAFDPVSNPAGWGEWQGFDNVKWDLLKRLWGQ